MSKSSTDYMEKNHIFIRDEASRSIKELHKMLQSDSSEFDNISLDAKSSKETILPKPIYSDSSYSKAAQRLKMMLYKQDDKTDNFNQNILFHHHLENEQNILAQETSDTDNGEPNLPETKLPSSEEIILLLNQEKEQSFLNEQEIQFLKDENMKFKNLISNLMAENDKLNEDLKAKLVDEVLDRPTTTQKMNVNLNNDSSTLKFEQMSEEKTFPDVNLPSNRGNEVTALLHSYIGKVRTLESQLAYSNSEKIGLEKELEKAKAKIKFLERINKVGTINGNLSQSLCMNCADDLSQRDDSLASKEKHLLLEEIEILKLKINELNLKEQTLVDKLKSNNILVEQAQCEISQAYIEKERMQEDLVLNQKLLKNFIENIDNCITRECEDVGNSYLMKLNELDRMNKSFLERLNEKELLNDKLEKEKNKMQSDIDMLTKRVQINDSEYVKFTEDMKIKIIHSKMDQSMLHSQLERVKIELSQSENIRHTDRLKFTEEINVLKNRLVEAESLLLSCKNECIQLHLYNQTLSNKVKNSDIDKNKLENALRESAVIHNNKMELKEKEFTSLVKNVQFKYENVLKELEGYIKTYEANVLKLQNECKTLIEKLDSSSTSYKKVTSQLISENQKLKNELNEALSQINKQIESNYKL